MTVSPIVSDVTSFSPRLSRSRTIFDTVCSTRSGSTLRLRSAISTERASLSRSNGTRRPFRLITVSSRNCTRSKVVKRKPQARQSRRLRIAAESSLGRESFTCVSKLVQLGQRMSAPFPSCVIDREPINQPLHLHAHRRLSVGVLLQPLLREGVENVGDQSADLTEFRNPEAACRAGRRAEPDAGGHGRLFRIEWNAVLVAGDARA